MTQTSLVSVDGVVLAAGYSRRMGTEKAMLAAVPGEVLWRRQWRILGEAGIERRWLSVRPDQAWVPADVPVVHDGIPEAGPLGGILAAGAAGGGTHLIALAVDLPSLPALWVQTLLTEAKPGRGAAGRWSDGTYEPLAALYPRAWLEAWRAAFGGTARPPGLQALLREQDQRGRLSVISLDQTHASWFRNLNTPADVRS
jgi:molybdopterin-guanine dinucleotide biosynthesis protein A